MKETKFKVITLCGSTKFRDDFVKAAENLQSLGYIVLMPHVFTHAMGITLSEADADKFARMHRQMIDMSDAILVINRDNYIGESTKSEMRYAKVKRKNIYYLFMRCEDDCAYNITCPAKSLLPFCKKKYFPSGNKYPECPYYCIEDK